MIHKSRVKALSLLIITDDSGLYSLFCGRTVTIAVAQTKQGFVKDSNPLRGVWGVPKYIICGWRCAALAALHVYAAKIMPVSHT